MACVDVAKELRMIEIWSSVSVNLKSFLKWILSGVDGLDPLKVEVRWSFKWDNQFCPFINLLLSYYCYFFFETLTVCIDVTHFENGFFHCSRCTMNVNKRKIWSHHLQFSKAKLKRMLDSVSATCDKCKSCVGTLGYLFWSCPKLKNFWADIF